MQFFVEYTPAAGKPQSPEHNEKLNKLIEEESKSGILFATGAFKPGTTVIRQDDGNVSVTDGPYAEAKEVIVGWAIINAKSKDDAIEISKNFLSIAGDGTSVMHEIFGPEDHAAQSEHAAQNEHAAQSVSPHNGERA
ncbi:MAG: hypothetical protein H7X80_09715 [bacterium]|nr:hypothetical protein [Candidatus Kapabacteria bacterium]